MDLYVGVDNRIHQQIDGRLASGFCGKKRWTAVGSLADLVGRSVCDACATHIRHRQGAAASHGQDRYDGPAAETKADAW